jgi:hypothetical protein
MKGIDIEKYLKQYPETQKWINQCLICQGFGYKPEIPDELFPGNQLAHNLR